MYLGEGFEGAFRGWWGGVFLLKTKEKGEGVGRLGGVGDRQRYRQVNANAFVKTTL